jgi:hypothetical protein
MELCGVAINDVPEDERIEERENLVDRRQQKGGQDQVTVLF